MTKLNPCPNCGNEPELEELSGGWLAICSGCNDKNMCQSNTANGAMNGWNAATSNYDKPVKTLRDEFAMAALIGSLSSEIESLHTYTAFAEDAYKHADAMLKEREK